MKPWLNTHSYDSHLKHYKVWIQEDLKSVPWLAPNVLPFEEAIQEAKLAVKHLPQAVRCLFLFESKQGNYDATSDLSVEEIFPVIWAAIRSLSSRCPDHVEITTKGFYEQLADTVTQGSCAQGRVTRLLNYYGLIRFS